MPSYKAKQLIILLGLLIQEPFLWSQPLTFTKFHQKHFVTTIFQDSRGFLWLGTPAGLHRYDGYHFKIFHHEEIDTLSLSNDEVWNIVEDRAGNIWVGTVNGLNRFDPRRETFTRFRSDPSRAEALSDNQIMDLMVDTAGTVWIATGNGLNRYLPEAGIFRRYLFHSDAVWMSRTPIQSRDGTIWVAAQDTLYRYEAATDRFTGIPIPGDDPAANAIRLIYEDLAGDLWIGTQLNGAFSFAPRQSAFLEHYYNDPGNPNSLSHNKISAFIQNGPELWIGTTGGGLNVLNLNTGHIIRHTGNPPDPFGVNSETIRDAWEDDRGNLWLGSYYDGLYQFKSTQRIFRHFNQDTGLPAKKVSDIEETADGKIWLALGTAGLAVLDLENYTFTDHFQHEPGKAGGVPAGDLIRLRKDSAGRLWVASESDGISRFDPERGVFSKYLPKRPEDRVYFDPLTDFLVEGNGDIWLGLQIGLAKYTEATQSYRFYPFDEKKSPEVDHVKNDFVTDIFRDHLGQLWCATYGGLNLYRPEADEFEFFPSQRQVRHVRPGSRGFFWVGVISDYALYIFDQEKKIFTKSPYSAESLPLLEDRRGRIWSYSSDHVLQFDPARNQEMLLRNREDLSGSFFWTAHQSRRGDMLLGGIDGLTIFHPDSLPGADLPPRVVLTDFRLFNQTMPLQSSRGDTLTWRSPLTESITFAEKITLQHWQNYFSLEFAALDLTAPASNRYRYQLEGYDEAWRYTDAERRFVTYTNLSPGTYTFQVEGATATSPWSTEAASLQIRVLPPWWKTVWAYLGYALLAFVLIRTLYEFQLRRRLAQAEAERWKELDTAKNRLFTNVTHEFRTPLTVILGMAEKIKEQPQLWLSEGINAIQRSGRQLLDLVNQMLDLSKLETNSMPIIYQQGDLTAYLAYLVQSYESYAFSKDIHLQFNRPEAAIVMDLAPDALAKVIGNLLTNAIKYTPAGGQVTFSLRNVQDKEKIEIEIGDTGKGIAEEHLPYIFDRFYQVDNTSTRAGEGTGIGLALVRELIEKMNGNIRVESTVEIGTTFLIHLPIRNTAPIAVAWETRRLSLSSIPTKSNGSVARYPVADGSTGEELPIALIIEDNQDVATYVASCLQADYRTHLAENGKRGVDQARELIPDIIICDLMMPEMDGYEVCSRLKEDVRTSHIPIIMLTAKADMDARLEGLRRGADAYLVKPFNREELEYSLQNLLAFRTRLRQYFAAFPEIIRSEDPALNQEDQFLQELKDLVHSHLSDEPFGIPEICQALAVSRTQLHRKLKALTGRSTSHVVRSIRLQRAKELLLTTNLNISEVAYRTGFKNLSHFSTVFAEEFGMAPSEMRKISF